MKKLLCIVLAMIMVCGLAACSTSGETVTETAGTEATTEASPETTEAVSAETTSEEYTGEEITLTFTTTAIETDIIGQGLLLYKDFIEDATNGKVTLEIYFNSSLVSSADEREYVMKGNVDMNFGYPDSWGDYIPAFDTFTVPFLFKNSDHYLAFYNGDLFQQFYDSANVEDIMGVHMLTSSSFYRGGRTINLTMDKKVTSRADLEGIKVRFPTSDVWSFIGESMGANSVPLAWSEVYLALQTGTLEGQDNGLSLIRSQSIYEVTKSVTLTNHMISTGCFEINDEKWESLSPELQEILTEGAQEAANYITEQHLATEAEDIAFLEENDVNVYQLTDEEFASYSQEVLDYYFANGGVEVENIDMDLYQQISDMSY